MHEMSLAGDACPRCGGWQLTPTGGMDLKVRELVTPTQSFPAPVNRCPL